MQICNISESRPDQLKACRRQGLLGFFDGEALAKLIKAVSPDKVIKTIEVFCTLCTIYNSNNSSRRNFVTLYMFLEFLLPCHNRVDVNVTVMMLTAMLAV